jgi:hypothetical protein
MINKVRNIFLFAVILSVVIACNNKSDMKDVAGYVKNPVNGLVKNEKIDSNEITCQWIPDSATNASWLFRVYIYTPEKISDSMLYKLNYQTMEMFRLLTVRDTVRPLLAERVANGLRDQHEFTVVFHPVKPDAAEQKFSLLIPANGLLPRDVSFEFQYKDITKAQKKLYGYSSL